MRSKTRWFALTAVVVLAAALVVALLVPRAAPVASAPRAAEPKRESETPTNAPAVLATESSRGAASDTSPRVTTGAAPTPRGGDEFHGSLRLVPRASLVEPPDWDVEIEMRARGRELPFALRHTASLADAEVWFHGMPIGAYALAASSAFCERVEIVVQIAPNTVTELELPLVCEPVAGAIRGTIASESGTYHDARAELALSPRGEPAAVFAYATVEWSELGGRWTGAFAFDDLPARDCALELRAPPFAVWPASPLDARAPSELYFNVLDHADLVDVGFRVTTADGVALDVVEIEIGGFGERATTQEARSGEILLEGVPENGAIAWVVHAPGFACARGDLRTAAASWSAEGTQRWITVELERGASVTVATHDRDGRALPGVEILFDGAIAGRTDARGAFAATLPAEPGEIEARHLDWRVIDRRQGDGPCASIVFVLEPPW